MLRKTSSKRIQFFINHLLISLSIALCAVGIIFLVWYPAPLAKAVGVTHIFLLLISIDVIVGPLFSLFLYKSGKKGLKFDLTVVVLIQLSAFSYGFYSIAQGRPTWIVFYADRFQVIRNNDIVQSNIKQALPQYQKPSWLMPQFVAIEFAKDIKQRNNDMFAEVLGGISLAQRPERYVPLRQAKKRVQQHGQKLDLLQQYNDKLSVTKVLTNYPHAIAFMPLKASSMDMSVLLDSEGNIVKVVDLRPWQ